MSPKQIVAIRKTLKLTQAKLAEKIGAQRPTVARWETGRNMPKGREKRSTINILQQLTHSDPTITSAVYAANMPTKTVEAIIDSAFHRGNVLDFIIFR